MFKKALIASAMLISAIGANAADNATFGVTGTSMPSSCSVNLGTSGIADYGTITLAQMHASPFFNNVYAVGNKELSINVICGSATRVALSFSDNKPGKNFPVNGSDYARFGVVDGAGSIAIASSQFNFHGVLLDNVPAAGMLISPTNSIAWAPNYPTGDGAELIAPGYSTGFIKTAGATVPDMFTNLSASITVQLFASAPYVNAAVNPITFNSSSVVTIKYL